MVIIVNKKHLKSHSIGRLTPKMVLFVGINLDMQTTKTSVKHLDDSKKTNDIMTTNDTNDNYNKFNKNKGEMKQNFKNLKTMTTIRSMQLIQPTQSI